MASKKQRNGNAEQTPGSAQISATNATAADGFPVRGMGVSAGGLALRREAKALALKTEAAQALSGENETALSPETTRLMLHELHVHQIELEMQNDELRRTQVELEAARTRYFDLYDLAPVGYCSVSAQGLILQANLAAANLLGLSRAALAKLQISKVIFRADQDVYYLLRKQVIATGAAQACELRIVHSDGTPCWVQLAVSAVPDVDHEPEMRIVLTDINDRKLMQAAMAEREARYREIVEWSPQAIAVAREGNFIYANAAALKLFGTSHARTVIGKPVLERVHPDFHAIVHTRAASMIDDKASTPMAEMVLLKFDGTPIDVEVQSILTVFDGAPAIQIAMHDVTERVRLGKLLQERNSELDSARSAAETANRAKSDFLANMSHELRTPLGTILGYAQLIESGTPPPSPSQQSNVDEIVQAGWYLLGLVNEVLDLATIESGKLALSLEPTLLSSIVLECQALLAPLANQRAIGLSFPSMDEPCFIHADRTRVKQVLINLLSNAIKYNRLGGTVAMTFKRAAPERVRICIADTGQGLAAESVAQLFQPFNRLGQAHNAEQGTGIGLVMCKRLIELMGGAIGVQSTLGKGSVFWIDLNLATETPSTTKAVVQ